VVVTAHNGLRLLDAAVASIIDQTFHDLELLLVGAIRYCRRIAVDSKSTFARRRIGSSSIAEGQAMGDASAHMVAGHDYSSSLRA